MGETLKRRLGPLPVWVWTGLFVVLLSLFLIYRKNANAKAAATIASQQGLSSNLGTVPVSNLTTAAMPMPINMGDTFVNTSVPNTVNVGPINPGPPSGTLQPAPAPLPDAQALAIGQAEVQSQAAAAGGNPLVAMANQGLNQSQVQSLASALGLGGGNFLLINMVRKQAGLPYYSPQGQLVTQ